MKDQKAFTQKFTFWIDHYPSDRLNDWGLYELMKSAWQAACEYKEKETDELLKQLKHEHDLYKKHLKVYEAENAKLRECVEFYADEKHWGIGFVGEMTCIDPVDYKDNRGGKRARQALKELDNNQLNNTK
jgi:hypothetical protein